MPKATASKEGKKFPLDSAPPDGFIKIRPFTYGEMLFRDNLGGDISGTPGTDDKMTRISLKVDSVELQHYELSHAIVEHNLTDENDKPLDLNKPEDIDKLDGKVGKEIERIINEFNAPPTKEQSKSI